MWIEQQVDAIGRVCDKHYEGATWHLALLLFVWFLLIVLSRIDLDRMIDRYTAAHIRAAEAQCRMEELP